VKKKVNNKTTTSSKISKEDFMNKWYDKALELALEGYSWIAMDKDGQVHGFMNKPGCPNIGEFWLAHVPVRGGYQENPKSLGYETLKKHTKLWKKSLRSIDAISKHLHPIKKNTLKPCHLCGGKAKLFAGYISCSTIGCCEGTEGFLGINHTTREMLIKEWNERQSRTPEEDLKQRVVKLERVVDHMQRCIDKITALFGELAKVGYADFK
jgi:hypothetical protein